MKIRSWRVLLHLARELTELTELEVKVGKPILLWITVEHSEEKLEDSCRCCYRITINGNYPPSKFGGLSDDFRMPMKFVFFGRENGHYGSLSGTIAPVIGIWLIYRAELRKGLRVDFVGFCQA